ncbi:thiamine pyrophosphate-dependent dehydrogenase E1 component subunit alpha [Agromyces mediolanus]|uniref:Acetoin:2,6-dichlorophenolindophenol oxidoreductase subunit alpha n=1 Tax=Agromyces mediolanus TaxID=41986 RepID=A0A918CLL1_AGRME|nr:thiamine pyrophosphate-dependent dehydrogenase E1 component subunit alpha [Agromyces mediolanus]GGR27730.1 acetoin:2,6-dichlorophenolindophenol oxidoreductase subunit alpha [Agromyces mediolanus]GLJ71974.1 acetoin:2,6-dichlorophenolindophenol oxidoreductase subunit alpha [Agromyces mediolanus]
MSEDTLLDVLEVMHRIRETEETITRLRLSEDIVGSVHLCNGQEAIYAGAVRALELSRDAVFPTYRGHGWAIACGVPPEAVLAELLGRESGISGGRGGSAYFTAPAYGMYGENSIVGAGAPIACGAALAGRFDGSGRVAVASFGEGAMNQGAVHEAMNFAAAMTLPVVFLVENNTYSELTPTRDVVRNDQFFRRASAYGMAGVRFDGNDPDAVRDAVADAVERCRNGAGPVLLEAMTQRIVGHYIGDVQHYRPAGELDAAIAAEPIARAERMARAAGVGDAELAALRQRVVDEVDRAAQAALAAPLADPATVEEHVYA